MEIVYADNTLLVANKPSGQLSVPGRGPDKQDCLSRQIQQRFADALVVHRLDMATSGLMLMARGTEMQRLFNKAFAQRQVRKRYTAIVSGQLGSVSLHWSTIDLPLMSDWPRRPRQMIHPEGRPSLTRWRVLAHETNPDGKIQTRLELEPVTGRSHQLRVHLQALGHPIVGDRLYGSVNPADQSPRLLLHAHELGLQHPADQNYLQFSSAPPF